MDGHVVLDVKDYGGGDNKPNREKMLKSSKIGSAPRKRLADISNMQQQPKMLNQNLEQQQQLSLMTNEYVDKLHKENMTLMKVLADRNKIIELSGMELQKLRTNLQKVQQQNLQLAQANSQMLAELNSGKDRLKALQHELGCKNGLLKATKLECEIEAAKIDGAEESSHVDKEENQPCNTDRRRKSKRPSFGPSVLTKENVEGNRRSKRQSTTFKSGESGPSEDYFEIDETKCPVSSLSDDNPMHECGSTSQGLAVKKEQEENTSPIFENQEFSRSSVGNRQSRRQSTRFKSGESGPTEDYFEIDETKCPVSSMSDDNPMQESGSTSQGLAVKKEDEEDNTSSIFENQEFRRSSVGRPLRRAAEKVQSYKEFSLKVKMRRHH